jgi:predicted DNA-binding transcriptional regulator AlpA
MPSNDPFVQMIEAYRAGGQPIADGASSDDPFVRMIEQARQRSATGPLVSIEELAGELGVSVRTLRRWNARPDAPQTVKLGRRHMYRRADVTGWIERSRSRRGGDDPADGESR